MTELTYFTKTGREIPVEVTIKRIKSKALLPYVTDKKCRNSWCIHGDKPCPQYDARPCCPPRMPTFDRLPERKYVYLMHLIVRSKKYQEVYPTQNGSAFMMTSTMGNYYHNIIKESFLPFVTKDSMIFKVNGCSGCSYKKKNTCALVMPSLEGLGVDVVKLCEDKFIPVKWLGKGKKFPYYTALGGFHTDRDLSSAEIMEVVENVFTRYRGR